MGKWINVAVGVPMALLNLFMYIFHGQHAVSIIAFFFIVAVSTAGFAACLSLEKDYR